MSGTLNGYEFYVFDLDGTLIDASEPIGHGLVYALKEAGIEGIKAEETYGWIGRPLSEIFDAYLLHHQERTADAETFARMVQAYRDGHDALFPERVRMYTGVKETLRALRAGGKRLAIATTKYQEAAEFVARGMGLDSLVDAVLGTEPDKPVKPDPHVIQLALDALQADPARTLVVGDTDADVEAAHAAGCHAAAVSYGFGEEDALRDASPEHLISDFSDLVQS